MITVAKSDLPPLEKYIQYLEKIWASRWLTNNGEFVQLLENKLEEYLRVKNLLLISNGTAAIHLVLKALELKGEVITTPFTFAATTNVIIWEGMEPIFADIDAETYNIDPKDVERKITDKTSAILAVHVYGNPCYTEELQIIAAKYNIKLIYDAAHAFGIEYQDQCVLNYGDISTLSFHATKVYHTIEGGAIVGKDKEVYDKLKLLRNSGIKSEEEVILPGTNAKMNEFQAIMGLCNLETLDEKIRSRKIIYDRYKEGLSDTENIKFQKVIASRYNYSYMPVSFKSMEKRDEIYSELFINGIKARKYFYPLTVHSDYFIRQGINLVSKFNLQVAADISGRILCLPLYADLEIDVVDNIINIVRKLTKD